MREVTLSDFEALGAARLRMHVLLEKARGGFGACDVLPNVDSFASRANLDDALADVHSHHILKFCMAGDQERSSWFVARETALFRYRFEHETTTNRDRRAFMREIGFDGDYLSDKAGGPDSSSIRRAVAQAVMSATPIALADSATFPSAIYVVPFELAISLVGTRRVYLGGGNAYVPSDLVVQVACKHFAARLEEDMRDAAAFVRQVRDPRLRRVAASVLEAYPTRPREAVLAHAALRPGDVAAVSKAHFPPCMQTLEGRLASEGHLRYDARNTLVSFLKYAGMSLEDALVYWQRSMERKVPAARFASEYAYNIKYDYGAVGSSRKSFTPKSCHQIIHSAATGDDPHGCPFKRLGADALRSSLLGTGAPVDAVDRVVGLASAKEYGRACSAYFALTRDASKVPDKMREPIVFFNASASLARS